MADVGSQANFVDTQDVSLTNTSDSLTYTQLTDVQLILTKNLVKHQLTDDTIDNVFSLKMISLRANMVLTNPEISALLVLYSSSATKVWTIKYIDFSNTTKSIAINGQIKDFNILDSGENVVRAFIHLEGDHVVGVV